MEIREFVEEKLIELYKGKTIKTNIGQYIVTDISVYCGEYCYEVEFCNADMFNWVGYLGDKMPEILG